MIHQNDTLQQWLAWRDDYRCARPAVSCKGCDTHYPKGKGAPVMVFEGFTLVRCSQCNVDPNAIADVMAKMGDDWLFLDEILFVATAHCGIKANHTTLKNALRELWQDGRLKYNSARDMFRLVEVQA